MAADRGESVVAVPTTHYIVGAEAGEKVVAGRPGHVHTGAQRIESVELEPALPGGGELFDLLELAGLDEGAEIIFEVELTAVPAGHEDFRARRLGRAVERQDCRPVGDVERIGARV